MTLPHTHEGGKACLACKLETLSEFVERYYRDICVDEARDGLARITAALAEREATGWTHVADGLPHIAARVYFLMGGRVYEGELISLHFGKFFRSSLGDFAVSLVSRWMPRPPLPAPPSPPGTKEE